ncbi:T7SS effector LXG polymorphic toxin [Terribacillus aidingensis]|uniref:T7SS effector LXG polymorphic toxin n=1 Tax=Terribacillus aidingensis TaxID=586416 RepID=UPI0015CC1089|nr:T7SS effector LXG polymorphic toxin [Terribacillus aidingensis]
MKAIKNLDVQDIQHQVDSTKKFINKTKEGVEQVKQAINGITTLNDGFKGKTADSIRSFYEEAHKPFLEFMESFLVQYEEALSSLTEEVRSFESSESGFIRQEFLEGELTNKMEKSKASLTATSDAINAKLSSVSDLASVSHINDSDFLDSISNAKEKIKTTVDNMQDMDSQATKKLDKPMQDIDQMNTYMSKLRNVIDKNNITIADYNSDQLTKQEFYKEFKLQADGRKALISNEPVPLTEKEFNALHDKIVESKTVKDDRFEWNGNYLTLDDGRIIRAYYDPHSNNSLSRPSYEFVSHIPEEREVMKEYAQEDGKRIITSAVKGTANFFLGDALTLFGQDATVEERAWAALFLFVKPAKVADKALPFLSTGKKNIDDLAESKGIKNKKIKDTNKTEAQAEVHNNVDIVIKDGSHFLDELKLKPNVKYESNGYRYQTDELGRISRAQGELKLQKGTRNSKHQLAAGNDDRIIAPSTRGDHGGHLIGTQFNGSPLIDNIVAMNGNVNVSSYKKLENTWANALRHGQKVTVDIKPVFADKLERPTRFEIKYKIDGRKFVEVLENVYGGK